MNSLKIIFDRDTWQEIFGSIQKNKVRTIITVIEFYGGYLFTLPSLVLPTGLTMVLKESLKTLP